MYTRQKNRTLVIIWVHSFQRYEPLLCTYKFTCYGAVLMLKTKFSQLIHYILCFSGKIPNNKEFSGMVLQTQSKFKNTRATSFIPQIMWIEEILFLFLQFCSSSNIRCKRAIMHLKFSLLTPFSFKKKSRLANFLPQ